MICFREKSVQARISRLSNLQQWLTDTGLCLKYCLTTSKITSSTLITRWAPPEDNNHTEAYIKAVSDYAGIPADDPINVNDREQMIRIVAGMSKVENGVEADMLDVIAGWNLLQ